MNIVHTSIKMLSHQELINLSKNITDSHTFPEDSLVRKLIQNCPADKFVVGLISLGVAIQNELAERLQHFING